MAVDAGSTSSLAESERRLRFLDTLASATRGLTDASAIMEITARMLGQHMQASRCAYARVNDDQDQLELIGAYQSGVRSITGRFALSDFGSAALELMRAGEPYVNADVERDPRTAAGDLSAYRVTEIRAVICVPLHKEGRLVAAMAVHQSAPRDWTAEEAALVHEVVARCWETLERLRGEQALREANERLNLALSAARLGDWSWDAATDLVTFSERGCAIFGLPSGTRITSRSLRELLHPDDRQAARQAVEDAVHTNATYDIQFRVMTAGSMRWISAQGRTTHGARGQATGMIGIVQDVTAWRDAEESARSEAQVLEVLNRTGAALAAQLDLNAVLQHTTDTATQLTGARYGAFFFTGIDARGESCVLQALSGAPLSAFDGFGMPRHTPLFGPTFRGEAVVRVDDITKDPRYGQWDPHHGMPAGHPPVRSYLAVPVVGRNNEIVGGLFFGHPSPGMFSARSERLATGIAAQAMVAIDNARLYADAQRASEERRTLLESERAARHEAEHANALKDEFLATLSHELRTPLSAILGWTHILRRRLDPASHPEIAKGVEVIERSTRTQTQLINDLLDMSRIISGKLRLEAVPISPVSFIDAALETMRHAAEAAGVSIELALDPAAGPVQVDLARLQQVIWNLLANAVKFTPRGGRITVTLEREEAHARIVMSDTGVGIPPEFLPHIFDRFRQADGSITRRYGGLGLGLAIVKQLVELHGGEISASSPGEGLGATFVVRLPLHAPPPQSLPAPAELPASRANPPVAVSLHGLRVLAVDDEEDARELLQRFLEDSGATVTVAESAEAALTEMRAARFDVLISDVGMPGTDGYALLRAVRDMQGEASKIPAIALTAFARPEDRAMALRSGFWAHLPKPVEPLEIVAAVAAAVRRV